MPGATANADGAFEPRCYTQELIDPILQSLWALYNKHVAHGNPAITDGEQTLWAPAEMRKGSNAAARFPCCSADCSPKPYGSSTHSWPAHAHALLSRLASCFFVGFFVL